MVETANELFIAIYWVSEFECVNGLSASFLIHNLNGSLGLFLLT
jgi:hypothetical protein